MNDLSTLLDRAAGAPAGPVDTGADLTRGHRALARSRRRRGAAGLLGVAAAGVLGVGAVRQLAPEPTRPQQAVERTDPDGDQVGTGFLAQPLEAGPYTFDSTPAGWEVQGVYPSGVTIAPIGFPDREPLSFVGKLVILFDGNRPSGEPVERNGRRFWVNDINPGTLIVTAQTRLGEPDGYVSLQYPTDTGWALDTMLEFLGSVHVGAGAQPGVG